MKISSASKKVLASALSAAMVVAFAPTVAFGVTTKDTTTAVSITQDFNNGTTSVTSAGMLKYGDDGKYYVAVPSNPGTTSEGASGGYAFDKWFIDADGDGLLDEGEKTPTSNLIEVPAGTTAVTLKAAYSAPHVDAVVYSSGEFTVKFNQTAPVAGDSNHIYKLTVTNSDGLELGSKAIAYTEITSAGFVKTVKFGNTGGFINILPGLQTSGEYTFTLTDTLNTTKAVKAVSSKKCELAKITIDNGAPVFVTAGNYILPTPAAGTANYVDAYGNYVGKSGDTVTVKGDMTLKTTKTAPTVSGVSYNGAANKQLSFTVENDSRAAKYVAKVEGPGFSKEYTYKNSGSVEETITEAAGTWTVTVTAFDKTDYQLATGKATMVLTEVKYDAAGGILTATTPSNKDYFTTDTTATVASGLSITAADGYVFNNVWSFGNKTYNAGDTVKIKAGEVNTITAVYTEVKQATAPEYSVAKNSVGGVDYYTLSVTPAAGTTIVVSGTGVRKNLNGTWDLGTGVTAATTVDITASAAGVNDKKITLKQTYASNFKSLKDWNAATKGGTSLLSLGIGNDTAKWNAVAGIASAITAGDAAIAEIQGKYYVSGKEIDASDLASAKALYEAVVAEATAQVAAYADGAYVVAGENAYVMTKTQYDAAKKAVADAAHAVDLNLATATSDSQKAGFYMTGVDDLVKVTNAALKTAGKAPVTKADIEAAAAVTTQLKAVKTAAEAEAALKAYAALTATQKALVATADVAAAEAVIAKQAVKDAQDDAAVSKARNASKTVKAGKNGKTTKKQSITLKKITSKSGAKVTYKKSSGSSKVSVKSGKAYLAKGVKKGTYKATVKATCGTQTAKIKVTFKVK